MQETANEVIEYTSATRMAGVFAKNTQRISDLLLEARELAREMGEAFDDLSKFDVQIYFDGQAKQINVESLASLERKFKQSAWASLIDKLGIMKMMSSKRQDALKKQLYESSRYDYRRYGEEKPEELPEITEETITQVIQGMVQSADEFLQEAIAEEYDFWKPSKRYADYKRNSEFRLERKIIRPAMVERGWTGNGFRPSYYRNSHIIALDNIFHALDGKGFPEGWKGEFHAAIEQTGPDGRFQTSYFAGKCYKNGNLHLEFLRPDLLERFNAIAGRNRLPGEDD